MESQGSYGPEQRGPHGEQSAVGTHAADPRYTSVREGELDETGTHDFWFGVIGVGGAALIAIAFAIFSNI
jgi:hypothetical protein